MTQGEMKYYIDNPKTLDECFNDICSNISLAAQSMAKDELMLEHLEILKNLSLAFNRLSYTKLLTISPKNFENVDRAEMLEEITGITLEDLINYIYSKSNKSDSVKPYLKYAVSDAFNLTEERLKKLLDVITAKFNGKKIDNRQGV